MRVLLMLPMLVLAGCSENQVLRSTPFISVESHQSPAAIETCIGLAVSILMAPSILRGEKSELINFGSGVVTLTYGNPVKVEVRKRLPLNAKFGRRIRECAETGSFKD